MIGTYPQLAALVLALLSPFLLYGAYLFLRSPKSRSRPSGPDGAAINRRHSEPTLGQSDHGKEGPELSSEPYVSWDDQLDSQSENVELVTEKQVDVAPLQTEQEAEVTMATSATTAPTDLDVAQQGASQTEVPTSEEQLDTFAKIEQPPKPSDVEQLVMNDDGFPAIGADLFQAFFYYVVRITVPAKLTTANIMQLYSDLKTKTSLRMYVTVLCFDREANKWESGRTDKAYRELILAVPLCNRTSHLTKQHMAAIVNTIQNMMRKVDGVAEFPSHTDIAERQVQVEGFCNYADQRITANLIALSSNGGMPQRSGDIIDLALAEGLEIIDGELRRQVNGETWYALKAGNGQDLMKKSQDRKVASLMATLDFPHVSNPLEAYDDMFAFAGKLARVLRFEFVDDMQQSIDKEHIVQARDPFTEHPRIHA